jgi:SprT protein
MTQQQLETLLERHIPLPACPSIAQLILFHKVHLTIKWNRQTKLGDYRAPQKGEQHRITINNALNKFSFFITLVHELAHLTTHEKFGYKVSAHGVEWKNEFKILMHPFLQMENIFPTDIKKALHNYMQNPKAASCSDVALMQTLNGYNASKNKLVNELNLGTHFSLKDEHRIFRLDKKLRKNYLCKEIKSGLIYRVSPVAEVIKIYDNSLL